MSNSNPWWASILTSDPIEQQNLSLEAYKNKKMLGLAFVLIAFILFVAALYVYKNPTAPQGP